MRTQVEQLEAELERARAKYGADAPIVKALQQQLDGMRSMEVNRQQSFLAGTVPIPKSK